MSRQHDESADRKPTKKNNPPNKGSQGGLFAFHPNTIQREDLAKWTADIEKSIDFLATWLEDNCLISVGFKPENASYFVILKERSTDWKTAKSVSVWHSDLGRAFLGLEYYLREVNPEFPRSLPSQTSGFTDF